MDRFIISDRHPASLYKFFRSRYYHIDLVTILLANLQRAHTFLNLLHQLLFSSQSFLVVRSVVLLGQGQRIEQVALSDGLAVDETRLFVVDRRDLQRIQRVLVEGLLQHDVRGSVLRTH